MEGCSGYKARLADDQKGARRRRREGRHHVRSHPGISQLHSRSMRKDDEAKEVVGDEVDARYLAGQKSAKQSFPLTDEQRRYR